MIADPRALLSLIPADQERRPSLRRSRKRKADEAVLDSAGDGAVLDSAADILALIPRKRDRIYVDRNPKVRLKIRSEGKLSRQSMQQVVNARRFNASGRAIRHDNMIPTEKVGKLKGTGSWKRWTPEAIQRAGFSKISSRGFAQSVQENKI